MEYPAPKRRNWMVQIEFLDGTVIDASSDDDAMDRWRRLASWTDPTAESDPVDWTERVLMRAKTVYGANLPDITSTSTPTVILDALSDQGVLSLRRK